MKTLKRLLLFISSAFLIFACSEDEEISNNLPALVGTWNVSSMTASGCDDAGENGSFTCPTNDGACGRLVVKENGTYTFSGDGDSESGTISATGTHLTICSSSSSGCESLLYSLSGGKITVTIEDPDDGCTIVQVFTKSNDIDNLPAFVGIWNVSSMTASGCNDPGENGSFTCPTNDGACGRLVIRDNGTYIFSEEGYSESGTMLATGTHLTVCSNAEIDCKTYIYSMSGDKITITIEDPDDGCTIVQVFTKSNEIDNLSAFVGIWNFTSDTVTGCTDPNDNQSDTCPTNDGACGTVEIKSDGTFVFNDRDGGSDTGTVSATATMVTLCSVSEVDCDPLSYTIVVNVLTLTDIDLDMPGCTETIVFTKS